VMKGSSGSGDDSEIMPPNYFEYYNPQINARKPPYENPPI